VGGQKPASGSSERKGPVKQGEELKLAGVSKGYVNNKQRLGLRGGRKGGFSENIHMTP